MQNTFFAILINILGTVDVHACTILLAGRKATVDGSTLLLHTDDCGECDFRLGRVHPTAMDKVRPVLRFRSAYPREVSSRSETYQTSNLDMTLPADLVASWQSEEWTRNQTLGSLAELDPSAEGREPLLKALGVDSTHTYGTLEGLYSIVNTKQVSVVESTGATPATLWSPARPPAKVGERFATKRDGALWDISSLTKVALAYCPTARCAVDLMGYLATTEGFYGGDGTLASKPFGGEILLVADANESWTFEISALPPDVAASARVDGADGGHSAVWVAKRIPDEHFTVVANRFTIRDVVEVPPDSSTPTTLACRGDSYRHSSNFWAVAEELARQNPDPMPFEKLPRGQLGVRMATARGGLRVVDWLVTFGGVQPEMAAYTNDRVWRVLSVFVPEQTWAWPAPTPLATTAYPWSAKPSKLLSRGDFLQIVRDVYRGAKSPELDLTRGASAGPYGDPSRYDMVPDVGAGGHAFPRAISMFRTSHSYVVEIGRRHGDVIGARVWASQGAPHAAVYTPLHVLPAMANAVDIDAMPPSLTRGSLHRADALDGSAAATSVFWRSTLVNNWARAVGFDFAWAAIEATQLQTESETAKAADEAEEAAAFAQSPAEAAKLLAVADSAAAARSAQRHQELIISLMTRLHDGYRMEPHATTLGLTKLFYPRWWLEHVGYYSPKVAMPSTKPHAEARVEPAHLNDQQHVVMPLLTQGMPPTTASASVQLPTLLQLPPKPVVSVASQPAMESARTSASSSAPSLGGVALMMGAVVALVGAAASVRHKSSLSPERASSPWPESLAAPLVIAGCHATREEHAGDYHSAA